MTPHSERLAAPQSRLLLVLNVAGVVLVWWGALSAIHLALDAAGITSMVALVVGSIAWLVRTELSVQGRRSGAVYGVVVELLALSGGVLSPFATAGVAFVAIAGLAGGMHRSLRRAVVLSAGGPAVAALTAVGAGKDISIALLAVACASAGLAFGVSRRQSVEAAERATRLELEVERAELEHSRAEVLSDRNRLARDIHDVLAHSLSALSVQLEALGSVIDADGSVASGVVRELEQAKRLVREGLGEARRAVSALREDSIPLAFGLAELCAARGASFELSGEARPIAPAPSQALYRVAQEALTNVLKHAPGARATVRLEIGDRDATLRIENPLSGGALSERAGSGNLGASGGGYGLTGIKERVLLVGGHVEAGPFDGGWRVVAWVPA